jgi:hypothetical protein
MWLAERPHDLKLTVPVGQSSSIRTKSSSASGIAVSISIPNPASLDQTAVGGAALQHHRPQKSEQRLARVLGLQQCVPIVDDPAEPVLDDRPE